MTLQEKVASLSRNDIVDLLVSQQETIDNLTQQLSWLKQQLFGAKSERRIIATADSRQTTLGEQLAQASSHDTPRESVQSYTRRTQGSASPEENEPAPRFDDSVPVEIIRLPNPDIADLPPDSYDIIGEKETLRLAQKPCSYVVLKYIRQVVKLKKDASFSCPPAPGSVLEKCLADVSLLVCLLIDKFVYYLPLYRQHQRMLANGIRLDRSALTKWVHASILQLTPIYEALLDSVVESSLVIMDETPVSAGRTKRAPPKPGKMKKGYFWPIYGDKDEIVFPFSPSRAHPNVTKFLGPSFTGRLLSDGYAAYDAYAAQTEDVVHACCWSHTRRHFIKAEQAEPQLVQKAIELIGSMYGHEETIRDQKLQGEKKLEYRAMHCKPIVDTFFAWLGGVSQEALLLPTNPFTKAASYALNRQKQLRVFLEYPDVPVDTNQVEREIRPIALGRKNWLFCWTEVGAEQVGIIQSLIATCKLQGVDPYTYLVDVMQRVHTHPASKVHLLTPRLWKEHFADQNMKSDLGAA